MSGIGLGATSQINHVDKSPMARDEEQIRSTKKTSNQIGINASEDDKTFSLSRMIKHQELENGSERVDHQRTGSDIGKISHPSSEVAMTSTGKPVHPPSRSEGKKSDISASSNHTSDSNQTHVLDRGERIQRDKNHQTKTKKMTLSSLDEAHKKSNDIDNDNNSRTFNVGEYFRTPMDSLQKRTNQRERNEPLPESNSQREREGERNEPLPESNSQRKREGERNEPLPESNSQEDRENILAPERNNQREREAERGIEPLPERDSQVENEQISFNSMFYQHSTRSYYPTKLDDDIDLRALDLKTDVNVSIGTIILKVNEPGNSAERSGTEGLQHSKSIDIVSRGRLRRHHILPR